MRSKGHFKKCIELGIDAETIENDKKGILGIETENASSTATGSNVNTNSNEECDTSSGESSDGEEMEVDSSGNNQIVIFKFFSFER